jgi:Utp21 specific WD40 associated putative domain
LLLTLHGAVLAWQANLDAEAGEAPQRRYETRGEAGAPAPLAASLVTLSLLPRTQASAVRCPSRLGFCACSSWLKLKVLHGADGALLLPEPSCLNLIVSNPKIELILLQFSEILAMEQLHFAGSCARSLLVAVQWHNLVHLDALRARSKPVQPPKKPEAAPFFLPTVAGADCAVSSP